LSYPEGLEGQSQATNIGIGSTVIRPVVKRFGVNIAGQTNYDSGEMLKDLTISNPGFEGLMFQAIVHCAAVTATTCTSDDIWSGWPANFVQGASYEFILGAAKGMTGTIASSTVASSTAQVGVVLNLGSIATPPAVGDFLVVRLSVPGNAQNGWFVYASGGATVSTDFNDLSPNSPGKQALSFASNGGGGTVSNYFDGPHSFVQMNGTFNLSFRAKWTGGSTNNVIVTVSRGDTKRGTVTYLNQTVPLTSTWQDYNLTFNAAEDGTYAGTVQLQFAFWGSSAYLDDVSLAKTNGSPSNPSAFRDEVVSAIETLQPGVLRYMDSGTNFGSSIDNMLAVPFARQVAGFSDYTASLAQVGGMIPLGLHEFLVLCQTVGAEPWYSMPAGMSTTEMSHLIEYLSGSSSTPYGAKRAALGQSQPWTSVFPVIHLELGNETWNTGFAGATMDTYQGYGQRASEIFATARSYPGYDPSKFDLVLSGFAALPWYNQNLLNNSSGYDTIDVAPYIGNTLNDYSSNEAMFGPLFAQPEMEDSVSTGVMALQLAAIQSVANPPKLAVYEVNMGTTQGSAPQNVVNSYAPSLGAGLAVIDHMLLMLRDLGITTQNVFALPEYQNTFFNSAGGSETTPLWGIVVDMGVTNLRRPQYLALQMANSAIGGQMLQTTLTGLNPTWNQPLSTNDNVQLNGAHYLQTFAFQNGSQNSVIVLNLDRSASHPVTFSGTNAPAGTVSMTQLTSVNITDTNETQSLVAPVSSSLSNFGPASSLTLPPYSMTVLTWTAGATGGQTVAATVQTAPAGMSFSVDGTAYTGTQTFNWTPGSTHTIATTATQTPSTGTQNTWTNWSDAGALSHTVTAPATATTYTANFQTQYQLTTQAGTGGTITPATGYFNANTAVQTTATANSGYVFSGFSGALSGTTNPQTVTMTGPLSVTANFTGTATTTIQTSPAGLSFTVDGTTYTSAQSFNWAAGSTHTIATATTQTPSTGTQDVWLNWSDSGAASHTVTASGTATTYTANFQTQYLLTTVAGTGGTISPASGYFNANAAVQTTATASTGYLFSGFSGALTGATNPQSVTMTGPLTVTANFGAAVYTQFQTTPAGLTYTVDGTNYTGQQTFAWLAGSSHSLSTPTLQTPSAGTQEVFQSWTDGGAASHTFTTPSSARTFWANFQTQYQLTTQAGSGGTISPATGYFNANAAVPVTATANAGYQFSGFSGALTGTTNPQTVTMTGPLSVTANFTGLTSATVQTSPAGLSFTVDGTTYTSAQTFNWTVGSTHTIATTGTQSPSAGTQDVWSNWSDAGAVSHTVTAAATASTYTANFQTKYQLTTQAGTGGSISPATGYFNANSTVPTTATANTGYQFTGFSGALSGTANPQSVTMTGPLSVTATFAAPTPTTIQTSPAGLSFTVDGTTYASAQTFNWTVGSTHTIGTAATQNPASGTQDVWLNWSDAGAVSHTVTASATATTYTANFQTQYLLTTQASPSQGGLLSPATGYYNAGSSVSVSATANNGFTFAGFSGALSGAANPQPYIIAAPATIVGNFSSVSPNLIATAAAQSADSNGNVTVSVNLTNTGLGAAQNARITSVAAVPVTGSGTVTLESTLPTVVGTMAPGASASVNLVFSWPATAPRVSFAFTLAADSGYTNSTTITIFR
jgi:alpha-L-arabinofuranosidase